jgi:hypothetical protein
VLYDEGLLIFAPGKGAYTPIWTSWPGAGSASITSRLERLAADRRHPPADIGHAFFFGSRRGGSHGQTNGAGRLSVFRSLSGCQLARALSGPRTSVLYRVSAPGAST